MRFDDQARCYGLIQQSFIGEREDGFARRVSLSQYSCYHGDSHRFLFSCFTLPSGWGGGGGLGDSAYYCTKHLIAAFS